MKKNNHDISGEIEKLIWFAVEGIESKREVVAPPRSIAYYHEIKEAIDKALQRKDEEAKAQRTALIEQIEMKKKQWVNSDKVTGYNQAVDELNAKLNALRKEV